MYSFVMSNLDEVKEILNTLRVAMSISFAMLVFIAGAIIKRYDQQNIDLLFWGGIVLLILIVFVIFLIEPPKPRIQYIGNCLFLW